MAIASLGSTEDLFSHTDLHKVLVVDEAPEKPFGILDLQPNAVTSPPIFTEEATIEAMRNLNVVPEDLVPRDPSELTGGNQVAKIQVTIELERRRYETIEKIIAERNRILAQPALEINLPVETLKKRTKRKKTKKGKKKKKRASPNKAKSPRMPKLPVTKMQKKAPARNSIRRMPELSDIDKRRKAAAVIKRQKEDEYKALAERALERVKAVEKRQEELRRQKEELIKQRAQMRMKRLKGEESAIERKKRQMKEAAEAEMQRQERTFMRLQERKQRKFEAEQRWRREKVYGEKQEKTKEKNSFSALRKKLMAAGVSPTKEDPSQIISSEAPKPINPPPPKKPSHSVKSNPVARPVRDDSSHLVISSEPPRLIDPPPKKPSHSVKSNQMSQIPRQVAEEQRPKRRSGIPRMCRAVVKLPVVGKGRSRIPCLRS